MNEQLHIHKKTGYQTASTPQHSSFQSRPFVVQPQTEEQSSQPDLKTALQRAERYGHRLDRIKFSEAPAPAQVRRIVQAKLTIGEPGDRYEQEADRVAAQVVDSIHAPSSHRSELNQAVQRQEEPEEEIQAKPEITALQRQEEPEEEIQAKPSISDLMRSPLQTQVQRETMPEDEELQAKSILQRREAIEKGEASTDLESAINSAKGGGQPLEAGLQRSMGQAMGADFSGVKVHTDAQADRLNRSVQARAFTTGQDVFFRQGEYNPGSRGGQELIAHELTHVVQQNHVQSQPEHLRTKLVSSHEDSHLQRTIETAASELQSQGIKEVKNSTLKNNFLKKHSITKQDQDAIQEALNRLWSAQNAEASNATNTVDPSNSVILIDRENIKVYLDKHQNKHQHPNTMIAQLGRWQSRKGTTFKKGKDLNWHMEHTAQTIMHWALEQQYDENKPIIPKKTPMGDGYIYDASATKIGETIYVFYHCNPQQDEK